jgi:hypothetical protein
MWLTDHETNFEQELLDAKKENSEKLESKKRLSSLLSKNQFLTKRQRLSDDDKYETNTMAGQPSASIIEPTPKKQFMSLFKNSGQSSKGPSKSEKIQKIESIGVSSQEICEKFDKVFNSFVQETNLKESSKLSTNSLVDALYNVMNVIQIFVEINVIEFISQICAEDEIFNKETFKSHLKALMFETFKQKRSIFGTFDPDISINFKNSWKIFLIHCYNNGKKQIGDFTSFNRIMKILSTHFITETVNSHFMSQHNEIFWEKTETTFPVSCIFTEKPIDDQLSPKWKLKSLQNGIETNIYTDSEQKAKFCAKLILIVNTFTLVTDYCIREHVKQNYEIYRKTANLENKDQRYKAIGFITLYYNTINQELIEKKPLEKFNFTIDNMNLMNSIRSTSNFQNVKDITQKIIDLVINNIQKLALFKQKFLNQNGSN